MLLLKGLMFTMYNEMNQNPRASTIDLIHLDVRHFHFGISRILNS
jgi:hypothetical protein